MAAMSCGGPTTYMTPENAMSAAKSPVVTQAAIVVPLGFAREASIPAAILAAWVFVLMVVERETGQRLRT
jgi:hypothetical protein